MTFQHRHYKAIARVIREQRTQFNSETGQAGVRAVEFSLASLFALDNQRFDRERFHRACDPSQTPHGKDVR